MGTPLQNSTSLIVQQIMETMKATLESKINAIVNLAYMHGLNDGLAAAKERQS